MNIPQPQPDPTLVAQQQAAQAQQIQTIQQSMSDQQFNMMRQFGVSSALGLNGTSMFRTGSVGGSTTANSAAGKS